MPAPAAKLFPVPSLRDELQPHIERGIALHQSGQLAAAEQIYRNVLARDPTHPDALHLLGVIALNFGQFGPAITLISRAIESDPKPAVYHLNLSKARRGAGRNDEALASARRAVALDP